MSRIKLVVVILICIFLLPFMVNAEECNQNNIRIQSISLKDKSEYTEELSKTTFENNKINLDLKMYDVGDYIEYELKVKNDSDEKYYFDEKSLNINSDYFDYSILSNDHSNSIDPNTEKIIYLKVQYKREVEKDKFFSGKYVSNNTVTLKSSNNSNSITNPLTNNNKLTIFLFTLLIIQLVLYFTRDKRINKTMVLLLGILLPFEVAALCNFELDINSNITIGKVKPNPCTYDGELVQGAEYVNGQYTYRYMQEHDIDLAIFDINWVNITNDGWGVILTDKESTDDVSTKLCTSINDKPIVSMSYMFYGSKTSNIDLSSFDTSNVTNMSHMFNIAGFNATAFKIEGLNSFDTSRVTDMSHMFSIAGESASTFKISGLNKWDTSRVTDMSHMFSIAGEDATTFEIEGLNNFDTSKVTDMSSMFFGAGKNATTWNIGDLSSWNTSNVTNMYEMFFETGQNATIFNLNLSNWDTSSVTNMMLMFCSAGRNATTWNIGDLSNWDTTEVISMTAMFNAAGSNALTWNSIGTLKVYASDINSMFEGSPNAKATLNIYNNPTNYSSMFYGAATKNESKIIVNYKSNVTNIDSIINTKSSDSNVIKGIIIN